MGSGASLPQLIAQLPKPPAPPAPPPPPDPRAVQEQKRVELTMAKNDVTVKQQAYDVVAPDEATQRKVAAAIAAKDLYLADIQKQFRYETRLFNQSLDQANALANSGTYELAQKYTKTLEEKRTEVEHENIKKREQTSANRRRFLDADPQSGVPGIGGFQTVDQQIMLAFWTGYTLFATAVIFWVIETNIAVFGNPPIIRDAVLSGMTALAIAIAVAHYTIRAVATS